MSAKRLLLLSALLLLGACIEPPTGLSTTSTGVPGTGHLDTLGTQPQPEMSRQR